MKSKKVNSQSQKDSSWLAELQGLLNTGYPAEAQLRAEGWLSMTEIANALGRGMNTTRSLINGLVKQGKWEHLDTFAVKDGEDKATRFTGYRQKK